MKIELDKNILELIDKNSLTCKDLIKYVLQNTSLHFKIKDIKGDLTKENVYSQLSLNKLYNDNDENIKFAYIDNNILVLRF